MKFRKVKFQVKLIINYHQSEVNELDVKLCLECDLPLSLTAVRNKKKRCVNCINNKRFGHLTSSTYIESKFSKFWVKELYLDYIKFIEEFNFTKETSNRLLKKALDIFEVMESEFHKVQQVDYEWLDETLHRLDLRKGFANNIKTFFAKKNIVPMENYEDSIERSILKQIENIPTSFKRLINIYYQEKLFLRQRQIKLQARKPIALTTIKSQIAIFLRFTKWVSKNYTMITTWDMLQENHVNDFLLTLKRKNREVVRKELHILFKLAKKKKVVTHIPISNLPTKEYSSDIEPLNLDAQKKLADLIKKKKYTKPLECILTSFCFYHGMSSNQIKSIRLSDIYLEKKCIFLEGRPPVFLLEEDLLLLKEYLYKRKEIKNINQRKYLIVTKSFSYDDKPVSNKFILNKVKNFTGYTPKCLRVSCYNALSALYGPQYLIDSFGLSLTQASRYGNLKDYLIEYEMKEQTENFNEIILRLNNKM